jgi:hypothetical protein
MNSPSGSEDFPLTSTYACAEIRLELLIFGRVQETLESGVFKQNGGESMTALAASIS